MSPLPVLARQFFKINYLHTSKNTFFRAVDLILISKSDIIIIVVNTDKKIRFFYLKFTKLKKLKLTHCRPAHRTETYFEYIAQWKKTYNTSYYVQNMTEHYFPLEMPINSNTTTSFARISNPVVQMGWFQRNDVTAAPRAHTSDFTFS